MQLKDSFSFLLLCTFVGNLTFFFPLQTAISSVFQLRWAFQYHQDRYFFQFCIFGIDHRRTQKVAQRHHHHQGHSFSGSGCLLPACFCPLRLFLAVDCITGSAWRKQWSGLLHQPNECVSVTECYAYMKRKGGTSSAQLGQWQIIRQIFLFISALLFVAFEMIAAIMQN